MIIFKKPEKSEYLQIVNLVNKSSLIYKEVYSQQELKARYIGGENVESLVKGETNREYLCIYKDKRMVGFSAFRVKNTQTLWLSSFYISKDVQKQGIGNLLIKKIEEIAKKENVLTIALETDKNAYWAINFYKKNNYKILSDYDLTIFPFDKVLNKRQVSGRYIFGKILKK